MNTVYKWIPYDYWQTTEYENWLKEQAASGLEVQKAGAYWARCKRTKPAQKEYRLSFGRTRLDEEGMTNVGWEVVNTKRSFILYSSSRAQSEDVLYRYKEECLTDIAERQKECEAQLAWYRIGLVFLTIIYLLAYLVVASQYSIMKLITGSYSLISTLFLIQCVGFYRENRIHLGLKRVKKRIESVDLVKKEHRSTLQKIGYILLVIVMFIAFFVQIKVLWGSEEKLPLEDTTLPIIHLSTLEKDVDFTRDPEDEDNQWENTYEKNWNPLAKRIYESRERGIITDKNGETTYCDILQKFYELTFKGMTVPLAKELMEKYGYRENIFEKIEVEGLDTTYVYQSNKAIQVVAIKGHCVMYIYYRNGSATLEKLLEEIARKIIL